MTTAAPKALPPLPKQAKRLRSLPMKLEAPSKQDGGATSTARPKASAKLTCRTGEPVDLGWAVLVHDLNSVRLPERTPLDYCHNYDELIGNCTNYRLEAGAIVCDGVIESVKEGDRAEEVILRAMSEVAPIDYQASIDWDEGSIFYLMEGEKVVNGHTIKAPAYIVEDWTIRQMATCPQGADSNTSTDLIKRLTADSAAPPKAEEQKPSETTETETEESAAATKPAGDSTPPPAGSDTLSRSELKKFSARFGQFALEYVAAGLSYEAALEKHFDKLSADLVAANAKVAELETKLAKPPAMPNRGERDPLSATPANDIANRYAHLGRLAGFAQRHDPNASRN